MFIAAFHCLSNTIRHSGDSFLGAQASWRSFIDIIIVTPVTGEIPNITDSGNIFARKSRQQLRINEERILNTSDTLKLLVRKGLRPVVFVDDFVGSGNQFIETWKRKVQINGSVSISFKDISFLRGAQFFYCPLLCTEYGYNRIKNELPEIVLSPTHIIPSKYSSIHHDSIIWPPHLRPTAYDFLYNASVRAGIKDTGGGVNDWRGFHKLALAVAFEHSVPDATLPIFYWEENGWKPLIRKN